MKKYVLALAIIIYSTSLMAQTEFDAAKLLQTDISGTARYMEMAGSMGAVGGDASAIKDNPAGIGLYKNSEFMATGNMQLQKSKANWYSGTGFFSQSNIGLNSFSFVLVPSSLKKQSKDKKDKKRKRESMFTQSFSLSYNKLANFNRKLFIGSNDNATQTSISDYIAYNTGDIKGTDLGSSNAFQNDNTPWISALANKAGLITEILGTNESTWVSSLGNAEKITPSYYASEKGSLNEFSLGWAGSYNNFIHLGLTANIQTLNYSRVGKYSEAFESGGTMDLKDSISTKGTGINFKLGTIICPNENFNVGLSVQSPTVYALKDNSNGQININRGAPGSFSTPVAIVEYKLQKMVQFGISAAYIYGEKGLVSGGIDYALNSRARLQSKSGDALYYMNENQAIKDNLKNILRFKIGGEYNINENITLRAGLAYTTRSTDKNATEFLRHNSKRIDTQYFIDSGNMYESVGAGYHTNKWSVDIAFTNKNLSETFYPYNDNDLSNKNTAGTVKTSVNNIVVSFGYKL
jgi:long-subunit fatty acid transport protein